MSGVLSVERVQLMPWSNISGPHEIDSAKVQSFIDEMRAGGNFPPVRVVRYDGGYFHIIDGHHRVAAAKQCGFPLSALVANGEQFEDLDNELRAAGSGRADDVAHWEIAS